MKRTLSLTRETLTVLSHDDLAAVAGAAAQTIDAEACFVISTEESAVICLSINCETYNSYCSCRV